MKERPEPEDEDTPTIPTHDWIVIRTWNVLVDDEINSVALQRLEAARAYDGPPVHFSIPRPLGSNLKFLRDDSGGPHPLRFDVSAEGFDAPLEDSLMFELMAPLDDIIEGADESRKTRAAATYLDLVLTDLMFSEWLPNQTACRFAVRSGPPHPRRR